MKGIVFAMKKEAEQGQHTACSGSLVASRLARVHVGCTDIRRSRC
jgi:hypothetical protein